MKKKLVSKTTTINKVKRQTFKQFQETIRLMSIEIIGCNMGFTDPGLHVYTFVRSELDYRFNILDWVQNNCVSRAGGGNYPMEFFG